MISQTQSKANDQLSILIVEDEISFVDALAVGLKREGFKVYVAKDGQQALANFDAVNPDAILLDVMLPKINGIDVCKTIRLKSQVPIIMVSAKSSEMDTVVGLEVGADDYVAKPYRMYELIARIRAVMRRKSESGVGSKKQKPVIIGNIVLDPEIHTIKIDNRDVFFTVKEFDLMETLMSSAGKVVLRDQLIDKVWGPNFYGSSKTLDVHIRGIRKKLQENGSTEDRISTVRGLGYRFEADEKA